MNFKKPKTFGTSLLLFILGALITFIVGRFNFPHFTPLAIFALLIGIGFIIAGYGVWITKKWGAMLGIALCCLKLLMNIGFTIQLGYSLTLSYFFGFIMYIAVILIIAQEWKNLK